MIERLKSLKLSRFHMDDVCPECGRRSYWDGYCGSCGYDSSNPSGGPEWGI